MKAVAYLRVSTEEQSLERQYDDIKKFAKLKSLQLVKIFDDKISGSKTDASDRKGFNLMEKYLNENDDVKNILVLEISRLGRKNVDIVNMIDKYIKKGINIHIKDLGQSTLDENGNKSISGNMLISILGLMAENEARLLSERIRSGKMSRAKNNKAFGGKIIGYKKGEDGTPVIDETQAPMIERIFELASQGMGMRSISAIIQTEFDRKFALGTLNGILKNTFHKGERKYNDIILEVPAIVSKEVWQKANDSIKSRRKFGSRTKVNTNIIQGKIQCGECGNVMHQKVIPSARLDMFVCKNDDCRNSINRPWLFRMIRLAVEKRAQKTKDEQVRKEFKSKILSNKSLIKVNDKEIQKLERRKVKAREVYLDDDSFTKQEYQQTIDKANTEMDKLISENKRLDEEIVSFEKSLISPLTLFSQDLEVFKEEIKDIIKQVTIHKDMASINLFGHYIYDLAKPSGAKLGWQARRLEKGIPLNEELPPRRPIKDEDLEMMVDDYISTQIDNQ